MNQEISWLGNGAAVRVRYFVPREFRSLECSAFAATKTGMLASASRQRSRNTSYELMAAAVEPMAV